MPLRVGDVAPDFALPDQYGNYHRLSDCRERGMWVFLYFYPKGDVAACGRGACVVRDNLQQFADLATKVFGISPHTLPRLKHFSRHYGLKFDLLSDTGMSVASAYGALRRRKFLGIGLWKTIFWTGFVITPEGRVAKMYEHVHLGASLPYILKDIMELRNSWTGRPRHQV